MLARQWDRQTKIFSARSQFAAVSRRPPLEHPPRVGDATPIICEVTPRTEKPLYDQGVRLLALAAFMRAEYDKWGRVVAEHGIKETP